VAKIRKKDACGYETLIIWVKELGKPKMLKQKLEAFCCGKISTALQKGGVRDGSR